LLSLAEQTYEQESDAVKNASRPRLNVVADPAVGTLTQLLQELRVPLLQIPDDLTFVLKQGLGTETTAQSHAAIILKIPKFRQWLFKPQPGLLHIDANMDESSKTGQMSYFCALLLQVLRSTGPNIILHFFCGQHVAVNDALRGPTGLMRSFLTQLSTAILQRTPPDQVAATPGPKLLIDRSVPRIQDFCRVFRQLLRQVPSHITIFCLLDGISWFERNIWAGDYAAIMDTLYEIIADRELGYRFKVLMTSPTKSQWQRNKLAPAMHIELQNVAYSGDVGTGLQSAMTSFWAGR
jgi:hypothetical protein